jgi:RNA polymerase sigma-70 factor, ECF subfamily
LHHFSRGDLGTDFRLKTRGIPDCLAKTALDGKLLKSVREKRRLATPMTNASRCGSFAPKPVGGRQAIPSFQETCNPPETQPGVHTRRAFEEMFVASRPKFLRMAYGMLRNTEDAEDAVQNAFVSACLHLRKFEGRSALRTWFTRIVFNAALMIQRKRKVSRIQPIAKTGVAQYVDWTGAIPASEPNPEEVHAEREAFQCIEEILREMNPLLRQAFAMSYFEELSNQEACAMLGVSLGTFKARLFRARQELSNEARRALGGSNSCGHTSSFFGNRGGFQAVRSKSPQFVVRTPLIAVSMVWRKR